jgi:acetylornithine/succinyldiaminopimelate/putrescine aminotransferase
MAVLSILTKIRKDLGVRQTLGIKDELLTKFSDDQNLLEACKQAEKNYFNLKSLYPEVFSLNEKEQIKYVQQDFVNFYSPETINPYLTLAAKGPWIITTCAAVIYDVGGYGMMGLGHSPKCLDNSQQSHHVMANIMTPSVYQYSFTKELKKEIGRKNKTSEWKKDLRFVCLNSGSEAMTLALRLSDAYAIKQEKKAMFIALESGFHGRTDAPGQISDSCLATYKNNLLSFKNKDNLITVKPNDIEALEKAFARSKTENYFVQAFVMEPVMGEGQPGLAISCDFYNKARQLTREYNSLFIVDSIQAGLRAQGCLSVIDYPDFWEQNPPDIEVYSKALNAGQIPLSVVAIFKSPTSLYKSGLYGNTMTANPKAMAIGAAVLSNITSELRDNIQGRGKDLVVMGKRLQQKYPGLITEVKGTGLLFSLEIDPSIAKVVADNGLEKILRSQGLGIVHGGKNALRMTPCFAINSNEIDLIESLLEETFTTLM